MRAEGGERADAILGEHDLVVGRQRPSHLGPDLLVIFDHQ